MPGARSPARFPGSRLPDVRAAFRCSPSCWLGFAGPEPSPAPARRVLTIPTRNPLSHVGEMTAMANLTPKQVLELAKEKKATYVDLKFMDFIGTWQHFSIPLYELSEGVFEEGLGFDGSSIRGWQAIHASDMLVIPDPSTACMDPFMAEPTLSLICNVVDPITKEPYSRDPRNIAGKAEKYLKSTGIGDTAYFGPEPEFFIFDEVRYESGVNHAFYKVDSVEGQWNTGREEAGGNLGYKPRYKEGYFPVAAHRLAAGHPHRDVPGDGVGRHPRRAPAPRGGHRRPGRDRHPLQLAHGHGPTTCSGSSTSSRTWRAGTARP